MVFVWLRIYLDMGSAISVSLVYDGCNKSVLPRQLIWKNRLYKIEKVGLHHTFEKGKTLYHVFSVVSGLVCFRLELNTKNLNWELTEIKDEF